MKFIYYPKQGILCGRHRIKHRDVADLIKDILASRMLPGDLLVVTHSNEVFAGDQSLGVGPNVTHALAMLEADLLRDIVAPRGGALLVITDWPSTHTAAEMIDTVNGIEAMVARWPGVAHTLSLYPFFCDVGADLPSANLSLRERDPRCSTDVPGTSINAYRMDGSHISVTGSIYLWPHICDAIEEAGLM